MKKLVSMLMALVLLACGIMAMAESAAASDPEIEAYVGTWYVDDYILEIVHMDDDNVLLSCIVTRYDADGRTGERWIYDSCAYDDVGKALTSLEIGMKFTIELDESGELLDNEEIYDDGAASFAINEAGNLVWTDFKETPGENMIEFEKVKEGAPNPVAAYEGTWVSDRAVLTIEELDDVIYCSVHWAGSAFDAAEWEYEAMYDDVTGGLTTFETGVKTIVTYGEDGEVVSSEEAYADGAANFILNEEGRLVWTDFKETPGENEIVFERVAEEEP